MYKPLVLSRHPSHRILRIRLPKFPVRSVIRLGSTTEKEDGKKRVEINSVEAIRISSNKRLMKEAFDRADCPTARWTTAKDLNDLAKQLEREKVWIPIVAKHIYGSRGTGNTLIRDKAALKSWASGKDFSKYIFENYASFLLEYRLHVTKKGCFYSCRKALVQGTAESERWRRHKDNSVWLLESNPDFHKPNSWKQIESACVKALKEIGADILSFDVRVQSERDKKSRKREYQEFILIECNSASSLSNPDKEISICAQKYIEMLPKLILEKAKL
jgi:biotin carboxylase